ncbi:MAG: hypothetical protein AB2693_32040, partial [Candidatus Thiodiazotropha sp.]
MKTLKILLVFLTAPKRISPLHKRHGRILYDKNALLEEQYKRRIRDMEEEQKAAAKRNQEEFSAERKATFNPRMVNTWLQNVDGVSPVRDYPANSYPNGFIQASLPNGFVRQEQQIGQTKRRDEFPDLAKAKSRAESYHHSYNRHDLMASHREN